MLVVHHRVTVSPIRRGWDAPFGGWTRLHESVRCCAGPEGRSRPFGNPDRGECPWTPKWKVASWDAPVVMPCGTWRVIVWGHARWRLAVWFVCFRFVVH